MSDTMMILAGLVALIIGGELLVRGSVATAERFGMSPLLIGLTLVGFGTSAPELVTSLQAARAGSPGIAIGNVVGSNIANILLILGAAAIITPVAVGSRALARDGLLVLAIAVVFAAIARFYMLDRAVGAMFIAALAYYLWYVYRQEKTAPPGEHSAAFEKAEAYEEIHDGPIRHPRHTRAWAERLGTAMSLAMALAGLAVVVWGGDMLVNGATALARARGISETVIGLTIVAVGTSMPEFVTSVLAAVRKHADVAIGNIMGSCIYNILGIAGCTALVSPTVVPPEVVSFDSLVMAGASIALVAMARTGYRIARWEGAVLLAAYVAYIAALWPK